MSRTLNVVRMQLVNKQTYIWVPLIVLAGALAVTLVIYGMLASAGIDEPKFGGGAQAPLWTFLFVGVQALTLSFPFSQAMSVTRREFYLGTVLTAAMTSAILAVVFVLGGLVELATNGWGLNGYFFHLNWIWEAGPLAAGFVFFVIAMLFFVIGFWAATIYKRFGSTWVAIILSAVGLALAGITWLITLRGAWGPVMEWILTQGALGLAAWGVLLITVLAVSSWATLRRAIP
ncbi:MULTISPECIES: hypothetical protein [unclassified Microbacterium]|uniref:hypothetical protein n=1 Tax=unclassified Microbacterium TaxID=2609290 RepID=UPI00214B59F5|nr:MULTISPECIES: hypothetical protein [unclassified Microbacterium]MCR2783007.1 hypothetical protein [Microbacterium sp. zg.B96]WIM16107.1 hypothetical protein QNO11_00280 [Microbacterium sp. zg-B96]